MGKLEGIQKCMEGERQEHILGKLEMVYEIMGLNSDPESEYDTEDENYKVFTMEKQELIEKLMELDSGENLHGDTQENLMVEGNSFPNAKLGIDQNCSNLVSPDFGTTPKKRGRKSLTKLRILAGEAEDQAKIIDPFYNGKGKGLPNDQ